MNTEISPGCLRLARRDFTFSGFLSEVSAPLGKVSAGLVLALRGSGPPGAPKVEIYLTPNLEN
jgi:hypothetical protein